MARSELDKDIDKAILALYEQMAQKGYAMKKQQNKTKGKKK